LAAETVKAVRLAALRRSPLHSPHWSGWLEKAEVWPTEASVRFLAAARGDLASNGANAVATWDFGFKGASH
jgi:hypothetical protein